MYKTDTRKILKQIIHDPFAEDIYFAEVPPNIGSKYRKPDPKSFKTTNRFSGKKRPGQKPYLA